MVHTTWGRLGIWYISRGMGYTRESGGHMPCTGHHNAPGEDRGRCCSRVAASGALLRQRLCSLPQLGRKPIHDLLHNFGVPGEGVQRKGVELVGGLWRL